MTAQSIIGFAFHSTNIERTHFNNGHKYAPDSVELQQTKEMHR